MINEQNFTTKTKHSIPSQNTDIVSEECYGYIKQEIVKVQPTDKECILKHIHTKNEFMETDKYFILVGRDGTLYSPFEQFQNNKTLQRNRLMGREYWVFRQTTQYAYELYFKYLKTQNNSYYLMADRETRNESKTGT
jgi:hypothetical protein